MDVTGVCWRDSAQLYVAVDGFVRLCVALCGSVAQYFFFGSDQDELA